MNAVDSAGLDLWVIECHKSLKKAGYSRKESWDIIERYINIMQVGNYVFDEIDVIWNE